MEGANASKVQDKGKFSVQSLAKDIATMAKQQISSIASSAPVMPSRIAILGSGVMGSAIAQLFLLADMEVLVYDVSESSLRVGQSKIQKLFDFLVQSKKLSAEAAGSKMSKLTTTTSLAKIETEQVILECVPEIISLKKELFAKVCQSNCKVFLTNTSSIPLSSISNDPRLVGLHFGNPPHAIPLLEVVYNAGCTSSESIQIACLLSQRLSKCPILVPEHPGFIFNRLLCIMFGEILSYLCESLPEDLSMDIVALRMKDITKQLHQRGYMFDPWKIPDVVGVDVLLYVNGIISRSDPVAFSIPSVLQRLVVSSSFGMKNGRGFYQYASSTSSRIVGINPELLHAIQSSGIRTPILSDSQQRVMNSISLVDRFELRLLNETAELMRLGICRNAKIADFLISCVVGFGRGSFTQWADSECTLVRAVEKLTIMRDLYASARFAPSQGLLEMAKNGQPMHTFTLPLLKQKETKHVQFNLPAETQASSKM